MHLLDAARYARETGGVFHKPPTKDVWESKAAELVGIPLGGKFESHDDGSEDAMVDFVGETLLGLVALEVTSTVDKHMRALADDVRPPTGLADHLQYEWRFTMPWGIGRPSKTKFWPELLAVVEQLEQGLDARDVDLFGGALGPQDEAVSPHAWAIRWLRGMGFVQGSAMRSEPGWRGGINVGFGGFMSNGDPIAAVTTALDSNHTKLLAAPADERHLFVWVHETHPAMTARLLLNLGPHRAIDLRGVDQVWIAPWQENTSVGLLLARTWTLRAGEEWRRMEFPAAT